MKGANALRTMPGHPSVFACPSCRGVLWQLQERGLVQYRCHVGHTFTLDSLAAEQKEQSEQALYSAISLMHAEAESCQRVLEGGARDAEARGAAERLSTLQTCILELQRVLQEDGGSPP